MSSISATSADNYCTRVVCCPCNVILAPFRYLVGKVQLVFQKAIGYILRVIVFMFGEYKSSWLKRQIMEWYKGGLYDTRGRGQFDPARLEQSRDVFKALGAEINFLKPDDGLSEIEYCHIRYEDVKKMVEQKGGKWIEVPVSKLDTHVYKTDEDSNESIEIILEDECVYQAEWPDFYADVLSKMGWKEVSLTLADGTTVKGYRTAKWRKDKTRPEPGQLFVRSHSPTSSWAMEKTYTGKHLGLHCDLILYDYRGTYKSEGTPSEGGYYLDIRAIIERAIKLTYEPKKIWSTGFCLGGAVAAEPLSEYPEMNYVGENTFNSGKDLVRNYGWIGKWLGEYGLPELEATEPEICDIIKQDHFNTQKKLASHTRTKDSGFRQIIHTVPDTLVPEDAHDALVKSAKVGGETFAHIYKAHGHKNGHSLDPLSDGKIWKDYVSVIAERNPSKKVT